MFLPRFNVEVTFRETQPLATTSSDFLISRVETEHEVASSWVITELKQATFLSRWQKPEVNILQARTVVFPRISN